MGFLWGYLPYRQINEHKVWVKYSHQRIKQILHDDYHCELKPICSYKGNRRRAYVQKYNLCQLNGTILLEGCTLNAIRIILQQEGFPLHEPVKPCQGAVDFLKYVENIKRGEDNRTY